MCVCVCVRIERQFPMIYAHASEFGGIRCVNGCDDADGGVRVNSTARIAAEALLILTRAVFFFPSIVVMTPKWLDY